jgi:hypothetical protein
MISFIYIDYKKLRNDLRKKALETVKLQKKCKKCKFIQLINASINIFFCFVKYRNMIYYIIN